MTLLIFFALLAGAGTALSPCVLPILPAVLSAGVTGGRRRPLGVVTGIVVAFTFATVALVYVIDALGLPDDLVRWIAIGTLGVFGVILLVPALADRVEAFISRVVPGPARAKGEGFWPGFLLGTSLGLVYAPCAGPILAGVITVSASQDFTAGKLAVAFAYAIGSGAVLYALMLGGRKLIDGMGSWRNRVQAAMGALMVLTAVAMSADLDIRFQTAIADDLPAFLVNPDRRPRGVRLRRRRPRRRTGRGGRPDRRERCARHRAFGGPAVPRPRARVHRNPAVVQHGGQADIDRGRGRAGPCRPDRFLDVHLHQLHPHPSLPEGLGRGVPRRRAHDRRRPLARVPVRKGRRRTSRMRLPTTGSGTRSCRTTSWRPGPRGATSTGPRST